MKNFPLRFGFGLLALSTLLPVTGHAESASTATQLGRHGNSTTAHESILKDKNDEVVSSSDTLVSSTNVDAAKVDRKARAQLGATPANSGASKNTGRHGRSNMAHEKILSDR